MQTPFNKLFTLPRAGILALLGLGIQQAIASEMPQRIAQLPGFWDGQAVETPVGPVNYDIQFHSCRDGSIAGVANTGASLHYWKFWPEERPVRLRFLSTFRDNREPSFLVADRMEESSLHFLAPELELLSLNFSLSGNEAEIQVFHHGEPHVQVRLSKIEGCPVSEQPYHGMQNSCRGSPLLQAAESADTR